jgi:hypothetical protein
VPSLSPACPPHARRRLVATSLLSLAKTLPSLLTLLPQWLSSKLTAAAVSSVFHSSGSMGARPPPWRIHGKRCRSSVVGASSTLTRPPSPRQGHGGLPPRRIHGALGPSWWIHGEAVQIQLLGGVSPPWRASPTSTRGMGGLPRWGMHVAAALMVGPWGAMQIWRRWWCFPSPLLLFQ